MITITLKCFETEIFMTQVSLRMLLLEHSICKYYLLYFQTSLSVARMFLKMKLLCVYFFKGKKRNINFPPNRDSL